MHTLARESASLVLPDLSRLSLAPSPWPLDLLPVSLLSTPLVLLLPLPPSPVELEVLTTRPPREEPVVVPDPEADATLESTLLPLDSRPPVARALVDDCLDEAPVAATAAGGPEAADEGLEVDEVVEGFELPPTFEAASEEDLLEEEDVAGFRRGFESLGVASACFPWRERVRGGGGAAGGTLKHIVFEVSSDTTIVVTSVAATRKQAKHYFWRNQDPFVQLALQSSDMNKKGLTVSPPLLPPKRQPAPSSQTRSLPALARLRQRQRPP